MALCIVLLDVLKLRRILESRHIPVEVPQPFVQRRVPRADIADVALEMLHIDRVEADDGSVESHIRLRDVLAEIVGCGVLRQVSLCPVQRRKEGSDRLLVGILGPTNSVSMCHHHRAGKLAILLCESGLVDSVVNVVVSPLIRFFYLILEIFGEQVYIPEFGR